MDQNVASGHNEIDRTPRGPNTTDAHRRYAIDARITNKTEATSSGDGTQGCEWTRMDWLGLATDLSTLACQRQLAS